MKLRLREKTTATLLIAIFMISTVIAVQADPSMSQVIIDAADRLVLLQHPTLYGWDWIVTGHTGPTTKSYSNLYGVIATGLVDAYKYTGYSSYYDAAELVADHLKLPLTDTNFYRGNQYVSGWYFRFLKEFSGISADPTYETQAIANWNLHKTTPRWHGGNGPHTLSTPQLVHTFFSTVRYPTMPGAAIWHASEYGLAAIDMGDPAFAQGMASVVSTAYPSITPTGGMIAGLGKALELLVTVNPTLYSAQISDLITRLENLQKTDGSFGTGTTGTAQETAYAVIGLKAAGRTNSAIMGVNWFLNNQLANGGWLSGGGNEYAEADSESIQALLYCLRVTIDIKPGSDIIRLNLKSQGKLPVAVLTTDDFDASTIDPSTVKLEGALQVHSALEDVDGDNDVDMIFHFRTPELYLSAGTQILTLTGETVGGIPIEGSVTIAVVTPGK